MCRTTTDYGVYHHPQRLKITGFNLRLSLSTSSAAALLPDSLSLLLLPRLTAAPLHINGSKIPSDSPAFLSLHGILSSTSSDVIFATAGDRLRVSDGLSFEIHAADTRLLNGVFRFRRDIAAGEWTVECKCAGEVAGVDVREAEVSVVMESGGVMRERVPVRRCRRRRRGLGFRLGLEDIPEERDDEWCCCRCSDGDADERENEDEDDDESDGEDEERESEMEGVGWAVDVGFWVMCLGVGLLVSRASSRKLRRRKLLP